MAVDVAPPVSFIVWSAAGVAGSGDIHVYSPVSFATHAMGVGQACSGVRQSSSVVSEMAPPTVADGDISSSDRVVLPPTLMLADAFPADDWSLGSRFSDAFEPAATVEVAFVGAAMTGRCSDESIGSLVESHATRHRAKSAKQIGDLKAGTVMDSLGLAAMVTAYYSCGFITAIRTFSE